MSTSPRSVFLEREEVVRAGNEVIDGARAGHGGSLFVLGGSGLGKTTALESISALTQSGERIGRSTADVMETALPMGVLIQAMESAGVLRVLDCFAEDPSMALRPRELYRLAEWLNTLGGAPLVLTFDDLHWADTASLTLLGFMCRRIKSLPIAVIGTFRAWPGLAHEVAAGLVQRGDAKIVTLLPLTLEAAQRLLSERLGSAVCASEARLAWELCQGNPLLLEQVAAAIGRGEAMPGPGCEGFAVSSEELLLSRFAGLAEPVLRCAQAASALRSPFNADLIAELLQRAADPIVDDALAALSQSCLVRAAGGALEFAHPLFRQALYNDLAPSLRARLHARAFGALHRLGRDVEAAEHAIQGELVSNGEAIAVLEAVGRSELRFGPLSAAVRHLAAAHRLAGSRSSAQLQLALGEALISSGHSADAAAVLERLLLHQNLADPARIELGRMLGRAFSLEGCHDRAVVHYAEAADLARAAGDGELCTAVVVDQALAALVVDGPAAGLDVLAKVGEADLSPHSRERLDAAQRSIGFLTGAPHVRLADEAIEHPVVERSNTQVADLLSSWDALCGYALEAGYVERFDEAERASSAGLAAARQMDARWYVARFSAGLADTLGRRGRLDEAAQLFDGTALLGLPPTTVESLVGPGQAYVLLHLGRLAESANWSNQAETAAAGRGERLTLLRLMAVRAQQLVRERRIAQACQLCSKLEAETSQLGIGEPCVVPWARSAVWAYSLGGRGDDALRVLDWLDQCCTRVACRWPRIAALVGRANIEEHQHNPRRAEELFELALELHQEVDLPLDLVETLLDYGAFLRRDGRAVTAGRVLSHALEVAETVGAAWLAAYVRTELQVASAPRRRRDTRLSQLTSQERRVAELAGAGLSNREIAQRLCLSDSTIESHLQRVYSKLQIHSRRLLIARAAAGVA